MLVTTALAAAGCGGIVAEYDDLRAVRGVSSKELPTSSAYTVDDEQSVLRSLNVRWWYDYNPSTNVAVPGATFLPMIFDRSYLSELATAAEYGAIMGYNEPDLSTQANVSVAQALADWPLFEATGARLGSPACAGDMRGGAFAPLAWFTQFMAGDGNGYVPRVDFIAVHEYRDPSGDPAVAADAVLMYLDQIHVAWGKPVRLTETNGLAFTGSNFTTWTYATQEWTASFQRELFSGAPSRPWLEGIAPYPLAFTQDFLSAAPSSAGIVLANPDKGLTTAGQAYAVFR